MSRSRRECGCHVVAIRGTCDSLRGSRTLEKHPNAVNASARQGRNTLTIRFVLHSRKTQESSTQAQGLWWLQRDSNPCFSLERADTDHKLSGRADS